MRIHASQAYRKLNVTRGRIRNILELREILQSFQTGLNLVNQTRIISGLRETFIKRYIVERTNKAELRLYAYESWTLTAELQRRIQLYNYRP